MNLSEYITNACSAVDKALDSYLPSGQTEPPVIHQAMRYSIFAGGKRLRPALCIAAAEACGGNLEDSLPPACAVEMIHTYSLIHDDLPCMDNDDLRRGKPTNHKVYGEAIALLAGDALLTGAFGVLSNIKPTERYSVRDFIAELADTAGSRKLIGGQVLDMEGENKELDEAYLRQIHEGKTAALLVCSMKLGAMSANATPEQLEAITCFSYNLGMAFQVIDDILDVTASTEELGKTAGKDANARKATATSILGLDAAKEKARELTQAALTALDTFPETQSRRLMEFAHYLLDRKY